MAESAQTEKNTEKTYQIYKNAQLVLRSANTIEENLPREESTDSAKLRAQIEATMCVIKTYVKVICICEIRSRAKAIDDSASENAAKSFETTERLAEEELKNAQKNEYDVSRKALKILPAHPARAAASTQTDETNSEEVKRLISEMDQARQGVRLAEINYKNSKEAMRLAKTIHSEFEFVNTATERAFIQLQTAKTAAQNAASAKDVAQAQKCIQDVSFAKEQTNRLMLEAIKHHEQMEELQENSYSIPYDSSSLSQDELEMNLMINKTLKKLLRLKAAVDTKAYEVQFNSENALQSENAPQAEEALTQAKKAFAEIEKYEKQLESENFVLERVRNYVVRIDDYSTHKLLDKILDKILSTAKDIKDAVEVSKSGLRGIELILASKKGSK